tara:strand:+ start:2145 stop:3281 length:1137 start_codon:yes stop_codon:yes gene_type:complete
MLKKTNHFLIRSFKKSINFKIPSQSSILLFGKASEILKKTIKKNNVSKFIIDRHEINLFIYILTLFKGEISFVNYSKTFIKVVNPKIVITYIDNDIDFYKLKYFYPNKYFIAIQNGYRFRSRDFIDNLVETKKKKIPLKIDYYLCFNKYYANYCKKFIQFNSILHGSYRNNLNKLTKVKKLKKDLLFISQYSPVTNSTEEHSIFYSLEKKLLPIVEEYCLKNKLNLIIMLRNNKRGLNYNSEISFYKSFLNNKLKSVKEKNSYNLLDKYENILSIDSTLGYEALVRNKKVFFFHNRSVKYDNRKFKDLFGWPKLTNNSNFLASKIEKKIIHEFLDKNLKLNFKKWFKINSKHFDDLIFYDYENNQLVKLINDCLKKIR